MVKFLLGLKLKSESLLNVANVYKSNNNNNDVKRKNGNNNKDNENINKNSKDRFVNIFV